MTARANLLVHGYERTAAHIKGRIDRTEGVKPVVIRDDGSVRLYPRACRVPANEEKYLVGNYGRNMPIERIEDDCICRLQELSATPTRHEE
jgi:hypothetical protein